MKRKIAVINSVYQYGSTGRICFEMSNFFNAHKYFSQVFYGRGKKAYDKVGFKFSSNVSVCLHAFLARLFDADCRFSYFSTKRLIKKISSYQPDIVILNNLHGYYINLKHLIKYLNSIEIPVLYIFHDCWPITGHCAHFEFVKCDKYKTGCFDCCCKHSYPKSFFLDMSRKNYIFKKNLISSIHNLTIVCPSLWMQNIVKNSFLKSKQSVVINNGIDTSIFRKIPSNIKSRLNLTNYKIILCVANIWYEKKGINDIIELSNYLNSDEKIILVGELKKKIVFNDKIIHIKHTNSIFELSEIYNGCDVFFNPTYEDTFSNVNMEALSCGLPVICYKSGGAFEMVNKSFIISPGDIKGAKKLINLLFDNKITYNFDCNKNFDKNIMYEKYLELINEKMFE